MYVWIVERTYTNPCIYIYIYIELKLPIMQIFMLHKLQ